MYDKYGKAKEGKGKMNKKSAWDDEKEKREESDR